ncbi:MAG: urease accessory protein UreF [Devosia sp.]
MTTTSSLQRLLTWLSPAFPVGSFAWSQGLETAVTDGRVTNAATLRDWIGGQLAHGGMHTDAIILVEAHRRHVDRDGLAELADLALALTASAERHRETTLTGDAFITAARTWPSDVFARLPQPCPYPVAIGAVAAAQHIEVEDALIAFLTAAVHTQISVAVRMVPLGQTAGLQVMAALEPMIAEQAAIAATSTLDDIGAIAYAADIAQMRHETIPVRVFRS